MRHRVHRWACLRSVGRSWPRRGAERPQSQLNQGVHHQQLPEVVLGARTFLEAARCEEGRDRGTAGIQLDPKILAPEASFDLHPGPVLNLLLDLSHGVVE